jgi:uncharacterized repeat protein (TIGR01451 family)
LLAGKDSVVSLKFAAALLACLVVPCAANAQLKVNLKAEKIQVVDSKETHASAEQAKPGDVLEYDAQYVNEGKAPVTHVMATLPIPKGTAFLPETAAPKDVTASTDGASYAPVPLMRTVKTQDGHTKQEKVPFSEYRSLRWDIGSIAAGSSKTVHARVKLIDSSFSPHP